MGKYEDIIQDLNNDLIFLLKMRTLGPSEYLMSGVKQKYVGLEGDLPMKGVGHCLRVNCDVLGTLFIDMGLRTGCMVFLRLLFIWSLLSKLRLYRLAKKKKKSYEQRWQKWQCW